MQLTNNNCANKVVVQDPSCSDVGDANSSMIITNPSEDDEQLLEETPCAPSGENNVQIFLLRGSEGIAESGLLVVSVGLLGVEPFI